MKLLEPPSSLVRAALVIVAISVVPVTAVLFGIEIALLVAAFVALGLVITFVWVSVQSLTGDSPLTLEEALTLGQPSAEEEQKRAVLRALKDLEYERSVGKISDHDYAELSARYREEAKRLIQAVDANLTPGRERAERLIAERVAREERRTGTAVGAAAKPTDDAPDSSAEEKQAPSSTRGDVSDGEERA
jgi:hypothetical protein